MPKDAKPNNMVFIIFHSYAKMLYSDENDVIGKYLIREKNMDEQKRVL